MRGFIKLTPNDCAGDWYISVDEIREFSRDSGYSRAEFARVILKDGTSVLVQESPAKVAGLISEANNS